MKIPFNIKASIMPNLVIGFFIMMFFILCCAVSQGSRNFFLASEDYQEEEVEVEEEMLNESNEYPEYAKLQNELKNV